jgi:hypothetical protein
MLSSCGWDLSSGIKLAVNLGGGMGFGLRGVVDVIFIPGILMYCCLKNRKFPGCRWSPLETDPVTGYPPPYEREVRLSFRIKLPWTCSSQSNPCQTVGFCNTHAVVHTLIPVVRNQCPLWTLNQSQIAHVFPRLTLEFHVQYVIICL